MTKKRRRPIHLHVMVSEEEQALIRERMAEAGIRNMGAYMRKMALNGYVLHVDLSPVQELVSLQRRCSNNLNQVAIQANTYGGIYPEEITAAFTRRRSKLCNGTMKSCGGPFPICWKSSPPSCGSDLPGSGFAVPRLSRLLDILSRGGDSRGILVGPLLRSYNIHIEANRTMRTILKIIAAPFVLALILIVAVLTFLSCVAGAVCIVACVGLSLLAILCLLAGQTVGCIAMFVLAFWFPPLGSRPWAAGWWSVCMV